MPDYPQDFFCDETGQHGGAEWYLGAIRCSIARTNILSRQLSAVRSKWNLSAEMKWTKVSNRFLDAYRDWSDVFLNDPYCRMRIMRVPRQLLDGRNEEQYAEAYRQFFFSVIPPQRGCHVYIDRVSLRRPSRWNSLNFILNKVRRGNWSLKGRNVSELRAVDSTTSDLLQLTDVILGATVSQASAAAKRALAEHIHAHAVAKMHPSYRSDKIEVFDCPDRRSYWG
jgi:hypothetical protein